MKAYRIVRLLVIVLALAAIAGLAYAAPPPGKGPNKDPKDGKDKGKKQTVVNGIARNVSRPNFVVHRANGQDVSITTNSSTLYRKSGGASLTLNNANQFRNALSNMNVQVKGTANASGLVTAAQVLIKGPGR